MSEYNVLLKVANHDSSNQIAIEHGKNIRTGSGHGPLDHFFRPQKLINHEKVRHHEME